MEEEVVDVTAVYGDRIAALLRSGVAITDIPNDVWFSDDELDSDWPRSSPTQPSAPPVGGVLANVLPRAVVQAALEDDDEVMITGERRQPYPITIPLPLPQHPPSLPPPSSSP